MLILLIYLIVSVICLGVLIYMVKHAPYGYEDETGFHYGKDPKEVKDDTLNKSE